jgi:hypothetical protein
LGWTSGPWPGEPPAGPLGRETAERLSGVPGTVGISGLADRIFSGVQYPESAWECGAFWLAPFSAKAGLVAAMTQAASASIGRKDRQCRARSVGLDFPLSRGFFCCLPLYVSDYKK